MNTEDFTWAELTLELCEEAQDALTNFLTEEGSCGILIEESHPREQMDNPFDNNPAICIKAYFRADALDTSVCKKIERYLASLRELNPGWRLGEPKVRNFKNKDWIRLFKSSSRLIRIGKGMVIRPSWEKDPPSSGEILIELDPGMAFGTGDHPSTRLCLALLEETITTDDIKSLLDVGTGSGILLIAALKLGARWGLGIDTDIQACLQARRNIQKNRLSERGMIIAGPVDCLRVEFDLVVANLSMEIFDTIGESLTQSIRPGRRLIASGFLVDEALAVSSSLKAEGLILEEQREMQQWVVQGYRKIQQHDGQRL